MCQCRVCVRELRRRVRIAIEREEAVRFKGAGGQRVIEVLSRRIAIDLNRDAAFERPMQTPCPSWR